MVVADARRHVQDARVPSRDVCVLLRQGLPLKSLVLMVAPVGAAAPAAEPAAAEGSGAPHRGSSSCGSGSAGSSDDAAPPLLALYLCFGLQLPEELLQDVKSKLQGLMDGVGRWGV